MGGFVFGKHFDAYQKMMPLCLGRGSSHSEPGLHYFQDSLYLNKNWKPHRRSGSPVSYTSLPHPLPTLVELLLSYTGESKKRLKSRYSNLCRTQKLTTLTGNTKLGIEARSQGLDSRMTGILEIP